MAMSKDYEFDLSFGAEDKKPDDKKPGSAQPERRVYEFDLAAVEARLLHDLTKRSGVPSILRFNEKGQSFMSHRPTKGETNVVHLVTIKTETLVLLCELRDQWGMGSVEEVVDRLAASAAQPLPEESDADKD